MPLKQFALAVGGLCALACVVTTLLLVVAVGSGGAAVASVAPVCATYGPLDGLSAVQAENARTIAAVAIGRGGEQAALVALTVGLAESNLLSLGNAKVPEAAGIPVQGVGSDHDSLGIFQQRAGWGTATQRLDPTTSTNRFLDALLALPDWHTNPPWVAAQQVQRSAYDGTPSSANHYSGTVGANYLAQLGRATAVLAGIRATTPADGCGGTDVGTTTDGAPGRLWPACWVHPPPEHIATRAARRHARAGTAGEAVPVGRHRTRHVRLFRPRPVGLAGGGAI